jgi:zinc protease
LRVVPLVCAALGVGTLVGAGGCRSPRGGAIPPLGTVALPAAPDGREVRLTFELTNDVTVVLEESHVTPAVALQAWVAAGAVDEAPGEAGLAHLAQRATLAGARGGDSGGPVLAGWSSPDATVYETLVAKAGVGAGLDALAAALARASFAATDVDRARAEVLADLRQRAADPAGVATRALYAAAFESHSYSRDVRGTEASVSALSREQVEAFHRRAYVGPNVTVVAVGDFDARAVQERVTKAFSGLERGGQAPTSVTAPPPAGPRVRIAPAEDRGAPIDEHLLVGFRLPALDAAELPAIDVLAVALARGGDGGEGRLGHELVRNRQLALGARASVFVGRAAGLLSVDARLVAGRADEAARVVLDEALALAREELSPAELDAARAVLEGDLVRGKARTSAYARKLGFFATVARDPGYEERYLERLRALTPARVRAVAEKAVRASNVAVAVLAPAALGEERSAALSARLREVAVGSERRADARRRAAPPAAVTASSDVVRVVLPAGPRVLVLRDPTVPAVWIEALWAGGLRAEDPRSNGVTALQAATLTRGTRTRPAERVAADAAALGGALEGVAGPDELGLRAEFLARDLDAGLDLLADCLRHPAFPEDEVEAARRAQLARARSQEDDAPEAAERLFAAALWPRHPYRFPLIGTSESLSLLTRRRVADHFQRTYGPGNLVIAVVGDVDIERVVARLQLLFAEAPAATPALAPPPPPPAENEAAAELVRLAPADGAHLMVGYPGIPAGDADRDASLVLARALTARLAAEPGAPAALVRSWSGADAGALTLDVSATPDGLDAAVPALRAAVARVVAAGFTAPEVERARQTLVAERVRALDHRAAVASSLAREEALGPDAGTGRRSPAALAAVTPEAVTRVARRLLDPKHELVAAVRPTAAPAAVANKAALPKTAPKPGLGGGRVPASP